eukprot:m.173867 g.173867  ORF g.173867 m.173867 type:complete len:93 (+) comp17322_c0_seq10:1544-1822(+)
MNRVATACLLFSGVVGGAYMLMVYTSPTPDDLLKRLPPQQQREAQEKLQHTSKHEALFRIVKENAESNRPIWQVAPPEQNNTTSSSTPTKAA